MDRSAWVDRTRPVRKGEELDVDRLSAYLADRLPMGSGPLSIEQFPSGHSNLTYCLRAKDREWVLRRPPFGAKIKTAHDMGREYRMLSRLKDVFPKVPSPLAYCEDESIIGAPFYVMERVKGVILRGKEPPKDLGLSRDVMSGICRSLVAGLVELHGLDLQAAQLSDFGHPEGYVDRQVKGWTERYFNAKTDDIPEIEEAFRWIAQNQPSESGVALIHNDYKYDNLVLDPEDLSRVLAILDWEMSTVGDPLMDLGTTLGYWVDPQDADDMKMLPFGPTLLEGNLNRMEVAELYASLSGRDISNILFAYVYALLKVAVIAQQIYKRFKDGLTQDPRFGMMILGVQVLGKQAMRALEKERIYDLG